MLVMGSQCVNKQTVLRFCILLKEKFPNVITPRVINKYCKGAVVQIGKLFRPICHVVCRRILGNTTFYTLIFPRFSELVIPETHQLWGSCFFGNCLEINIDFENAKKNSEKISSFWDNCIWIRGFKLSLLSK